MDIRSLFTQFPTLTTQRLMLRALRQTDLQDLFDYASDPEIDRYIGPEADGLEIRFRIK